MNSDPDFARDQRNVLSEIEYYISNEPSSEEERQGWGPIDKGHPLHSAVHNWESHFPNRALPAEGRELWKALLRASRDHRIDDTMENSRAFLNWVRSVPEPTPRWTRMEIDRHYEKVIGNIGRVGRMMQKTPLAFSAYGEEQLRDYLLPSLGIDYPDGATGETYNRTGKTDIRVSINGYNALIAECGIWNGSKYFNDKVLQLFGYLGPQDTHAAMIFFNRQAKQFSEINRKMCGVMAQHVGCREVENTEYPRFVLRHPSDDTADLILAVLAFDLTV